MSFAKNSGARDDALSRVKAAFRKWCGLLSIEEIVVNRDLSIEIARLERLLLVAGA